MDIVDCILADSLKMTKLPQHKEVGATPVLYEYHPASEEDWETLEELVKKGCLTPLDSKLTQMPPQLYAVNEQRLGGAGAECLGGMGNIVKI